jgi:hypothetical protein
MVGIPIDLLWLSSLDLIMGEEKDLEKRKKKKKSRSRKHEETERKGGHPHFPCC